MQPVFIIGCQRSGTTLLGAMLGGHPGAITVPDTTFLVEMLPDEDGPHVDPGEVIDRIAAHPRFRRFGFPLGSDRPQKVAEGNGFRIAIEWYVNQFAKARGREGATLWIEHYPAHARNVPSLMKTFPDAKFIHMVRDGRAVAASLMNVEWGPKDIISVARFWIQMIGFGHGARQAVPTENFADVRYEDLITSPEKVMRDLAKFLNIDFVPAMLESKSYWVPAYARVQQCLVGSPLDEHRIEAWKQTLSAREIEIFEHETGDLLTCFGYQKLSDPRKFGISALEKVKLALAGRLGSWYRTFKYHRAMKGFEHTPGD